MDIKHSKGMLNRVILAGGLSLLILQSVAFGLIYTSFGTSVGKSFGSPEEKNISIVTQLYIPVNGTIKDLDISLDLKHTSFCDLSIIIESPSGVSAAISFYNEYNFVKNKECLGWITLDNESTVTIDLAQNLSVGSFKPTGLQSLSTLYSQSSFGMWKIKVCDLRYYDTGTLDAIQFDMVIDPQLPISVLSIPEPSTLIFSIGGLYHLVFLRARR